VVRSMKLVSVSFLVGFATLALTTPAIHGQNRSMRARPTMTRQQFHFNGNEFNRARPFFSPRPFGFDPFLRERRDFDPFLRREFGFDPFPRREFDFDRFQRRRFSFDPIFAAGIIGFPSLAVAPFFFGGLNGF